jgi:acetyltransferase-like isoleucine patch superfamily enzyme
VVARGPGASLTRPALLSVGIWSKITASHYLEMSESILIGNYSTIAGVGSQIWTHGFVHMSEGLSRATVRGRIRIGHNVYVGSHSTLNAGITLGDAVAVGAHSSVAKSLLEPGVYVSQELRYIRATPEQRLEGLDLVREAAGSEPFYWRPGGGPLPGTVLMKKGRR